MWDRSSNLGLESSCFAVCKKKVFVAPIGLGPVPWTKIQEWAPLKRSPMAHESGLSSFPLSHWFPWPWGGVSCDNEHHPMVCSEETWHLGFLRKVPSFPLSNVVLETTRSPIPYLCEHEGISFTRSPFWTWLRRIDAADFGQSPFGFDHCHLHRHVRELKKTGEKFLGFRLHVEGWWILLRFWDTIGDGLDWRRHTKWDKKREKSFVWSVVSCKGGCAILRITLRGARRLAGNHGLIVWYNNYCNYGGGCWTFFSNDWWLSI